MASTEARELRLVDAVDFKILNIANDEKKLTQTLERYLAPLILKAASEHASVRNKVITILSRLRTFIQPPEVVLPVTALLDQYKTSDSPIVKQLDITFIQHSLERIDEDDRRALLPKALPGCSVDEGEARAGGFLGIILRLLLDVRIPPRGSKDDEAFRSSLSLSEPKDADYLARMIGVFLRLRSPNPGQTWPQANPSLSPVELSLFAVDKLTTDKIFTRMSELKAKLVVFLASGAFTDDEKFLPCIYGASSFDNRVASAAEEVIRRSSVSMEDEGLVGRLFHAHSVLPAAYRTRILGMLAKSAVSVRMKDEILAVVRLDFRPEADDDTHARDLKPASRHERTKLHKSLFQYLAWIAHVGPSQKDFNIGGELINYMKSYIMSQKWPVPERINSDEATLRSKAYETIGLLSRCANLTEDESVHLGSWLFQSLSEDPTGEAVVNIDGALSSLSATVSPKDRDCRNMLKTVLLTYMMLPDEPPAIRSTRHAVVKWANECLPFSDVHARWIDILAQSGQDERSDVVEQGQRGLDPYTYFAHKERGTDLPDWNALVRVLFGPKINPGTLDHESLPDALSLSADPILTNYEGSQMQALPLAIEYCKDIIFLTAFGESKIEPHWKQILSARMSGDVADRENLRMYLASVDSGNLVFYLKAALSGACYEKQDVAERSLRCLVEVASLMPEGPLSVLASRSDRLLDVVKKNKKEVRNLAARAIGILGAHPANDMADVEKWFERLDALMQNAPSAIGPALNAAEGALAAVGHLASRCRYYDRELPSGMVFPLEYLTQEGIPDSLAEAAVQTFSQLWPAKLGLPPPEGTNNTQTIVDKLSKQAKKGNEKAIIALGKLAVGLDDDANETLETGNEWAGGVLGSILRNLFELHENKQVEVQFTTGNAISSVVACWDSDYIKLERDVPCRTLDWTSTARITRLESVLQKLFKDCKATKPSLLKASGIWLFCIVQSCSHLEPVQSRLREAQASFMRLLSARDELVQETASRGLSLVYERGDEVLRGTLVKDLVSAFTGSGPQIKVDEDTELFEPGALPTGEGSSITSYKDIVSLANEVGDQRLVYKFMSLAANAATWSTRSAFGRFGLSNILSESEIDPKLYPKLYRYRFDPNTNVQRSMDEIWKALVKDTSATLDEHFDDILDDLLKSILGREWRMREASCAAISELLQGRPFIKYEKYYKEVWTKALKVLDDVKGSVRKAALHLCMALSTTLVRQLEEDNSRAMAQGMMKEALPFLLSDKGVESTTADVQSFAAITVLKIAKKGGTALKPFIPDMVPQLLGLLSTIEPEQINWHYQRAGEDNRDKIDKLRTQMVNQSPISEAIENSLRFIDSDVMTQLAPRFENTIKTAIGMPTKIGCSRVLVTLFTRHANDIKPVSARLLGLMEKQTMDSNDEVSQAYARAAAYILRAVPDDTKRHFCTRLADMYLQSQDEARRQKIADVVVALAKVSPDHFTSQEIILLPLCYLGSHDVEEYTSKVFKEAWEQHAGSKRSVVRFVPEIVKLVEQCLETTQWSLRHGAAFAVAGMISDVASASDATGGINKANLKALWPVLDKTLALKTFDGKEKLLRSFPDFVEKGPELWQSSDQIAAQMKKIAIREAKRNNDAYRVHAFECLWRFAKVRPDLDMLTEIADLVIPYLDEFKDEDKMEVDSKDDHSNKTARNGLEAIARGYSRGKMQSKPGEVLTEIIRRLQPYLPDARFKPLKREVWYKSVADLMSDAVRGIEKGGSGSVDASGSAYLTSLDLDVAEAGTESQRLDRVAAVASILRAAKAGAFGGDGFASSKEAEEAVRSALREERALDVQKAWRETLDMI